MVFSLSMSSVSACRGPVKAVASEEVSVGVLLGAGSTCMHPKSNQGPKKYHQGKAVQACGVTWQKHPEGNPELKETNGGVSQHVALVWS